MEMYMIGKVPLQYLPPRRLVESTRVRRPCRITSLGKEEGINYINSAKYEVEEINESIRVYVCECLVCTCGRQQESGAGVSTQLFGNKCLSRRKMTQDTKKELCEWFNMLMRHVGCL